MMEDAAKSLNIKDLADWYDLSISSVPYRGSFMALLP
jgi:hypothetical protein